MDSSWQPVSKWYDASVGDKGHYFHEHVIIPKVIALLNLHSTSKLVDLACGQGVLSRHIPKNTPYLGFDASPALIKFAKSRSTSPSHIFKQADIEQPLDIKDIFTHATIILALQNINNVQSVLSNTAKLLTPNGTLVLVLNHPAFRIPRQSSWVEDPQNKQLFRRINRYLSPLKIPISTHPGQTNSPITWSFHLPISSYFSYLKTAGFVVTDLEEWTSDKESVGKHAKMENLSRKEFPLFLCIKASKTATS